MLINRCIIVLFATVLSFATPAAAQQKQEVMLLTYHLKAPYIVNLGEQKGLYYDLAAYLNSHSQHYQFKTEFMPRKRIDAMLQKPFEHVVVGVQPNWFKAFADKLRFTAPILQESDVFVSLSSNALTDSELASLNGKTFIGVQGYRYIKLEPAEKDGNLNRVDTLQEDSVLDMLRLGRGDFTIMSLSALEYKFARGEKAADFYIAKQPHEHVQRRLMLSKENTQLAEELDTLLEHMLCDPAWLSTLKQYGLDQSFLP